MARTFIRLGIEQQSAKSRHQINLNTGADRQSGYPNAGSSRQFVGLKIALINRVHGVEMLKIDKIDPRENNLFERAARLGQDVLQVFHDLMGLVRDVVADQFCRIIFKGRHLAGHEKKITSFDRVTKRADAPWPVAKDKMFYIHGPSP
jgi:hypothetical protein